MTRSRRSRRSKGGEDRYSNLFHVMGEDGVVDSVTLCGSAQFDVAGGIKTPQRYPLIRLVSMGADDNKSKD